MQSMLVTKWNMNRFIPYLLINQNNLKFIQIIPILLSVITNFSSAEFQSTDSDELKWKKTNLNVMSELQLNYLIYDASIISFLNIDIHIVSIRGIYKKRLITANNAFKVYVSNKLTLHIKLML